MYKAHDDSAIDETETSCFSQLHRFCGIRSIVLMLGDMFMERWLATVVSTNIIRYSRLMEADEVDLLARMKACRAELWTAAIEKGGETEIGGYAIKFNRHLYKYVPPRPLEEIESNIQATEKDIVAVLREVAG